ncbi:MAG TPA: type II toxin-antitoxin system VapC family toxin [Burkholderiales bacterium]|nr:type II toxin-antitoxin system VapC family toxin [Burkholderiales bacterium]
MIVLDTHALVWADRDDRKLGRKARATLNKLWPAGEVAAPAIVFWELGLLEANGRVRLPLPVRDWRLALIAAGLLELPLTGEIAIRATELSGLHGDPADRFVAATALAEGATLMTADDRLLGWRHALDRVDARD